MKPRNPTLVLFWSFGLFILMHTTRYAGMFFVSLFSGASFESVISGEFKNHLTILGDGLTAVIIGIPIALLITKYLWRRPWNWLRLRLKGKLLLYGFLLGIVLPVVVLLLVSLWASVKITATPDRFSVGELVCVLIGSLGLVVFTAVSEELSFRGMAVREWALKWRWPVAIVLGGIYFGVLHLIGLISHLTVFNTIWIIVAATVVNLLFVSLYIRGKSLWLPIGFHAGWNLSLNTFLGTTMSGKSASFGLLATEISEGPDIVTGGIFGIEASIVTMVLTVAICVPILRYSRVGKPDLLSPTSLQDD